MFCKICGTQIADDAMFCLNCGNKVHDDVPVTEQQMTEDSQMSQQPAYSQPVMQPTSYHQPSFQQAPNMGVVQPVYPQPVYQNKVAGKSSKAKLFAIIFGILACILAVAVAVDAFIGGELGTAFENLGFSIFSVLVIWYAVSKSKAAAVAKGVGALAATVLHVVFFGASAFMAAFDILGDAKAGTDYYYAVILLIELVLFYLYMLINIIKSFTNSDKPSNIMLLAGYISAILIIAAFVVDWVSDVDGLFAFKFIPVDLALVFMILADVFAVFARAKK